MYARKDHIHFVGIGGAGMCPLAELMHARGQVVSGSDSVESASTKRLRSLGIKVQYSHKVDYVKTADLLVYSSAIADSSEELVFARSKGILCIKRAVMLGDLMKMCFTIAIAGTHGKTSTTALVGAIFRDTSMDPTVLLGGTFQDSQSHAIIGNSQILIAEADEYDRSFLSMYPTMAIITNIESDHLDTYGNFKNIKDAFLKFIDKIPFYGVAILCLDDPTIREIKSELSKKCITYGTYEEADYIGTNIIVKENITEFDVICYGKSLGTVSLPLMGVHNVRNALAAIVAGLEMGIDFKYIKNSLAQFLGTKRRLETLGKKKGVTVIDDYAHHPTEITATLKTLIEHPFYKRVFAIFQPHLYTRTINFLDDFAQSLTLADHTIVTEIYRARDKERIDISGRDIVETMKELGNSTSTFIEDMYSIPEYLCTELQEDDCVIIMGAGNIWQVGEEILKRI